MSLGYFRGKVCAPGLSLQRRNRTPTVCHRTLSGEYRKIPAVNLHVSGDSGCVLATTGDKVETRVARLTASV